MNKIVAIQDNVHLNFRGPDTKRQITNPDDVQVGYWYSKCCHLDLYQVEADDVDWLKEELTEEEPEPFVPMVWATKRDALLDIREMFADGSAQRAEVDALL